MVEYSLSLDLVFGSLADPTRRDIFKRVSIKEQTVSEVAKHYKISLAGISKHLKILERAKLIQKRQHGRQQFIKATPATLKSVQDYVAQYERLWNKRFDALETYLKKEN
jgi:DNA-binding transcriptional ArsR family regulator